MEMSEERKKRLRELAISGGLSGGVLGTLTNLRSFRKPTDLLRYALTGAGVGAGLASGSGYVGGEILGELGEHEQGGHTLRGVVGGSLGGAAVGGAVGSLAAIPAVAGGLQKKLGQRNFVTKAVTKALGAGGLSSGYRGALMGALGLGAAGAFVGSDEGMQLDFVDSMRKEIANKAKKEQLMREMYVP